MFRPFTSFTLAGSAMAVRWWLACIALLAAAANASPLVDAAWLAQRLGDPEILVIDASFPPVHAAGHIPGAINVDVFSFGAKERSPADMEQRFREWGVGAKRRIVLYDPGGTYLATSLYFDLYYHGFPADRLHLLDGGLARWKAAGGALTRDATPKPAPGDFRVDAVRAEARVRLDEFTAASGDPRRHALVEALETSYHTGATRFFDRGGHVPHAISLPNADLFNADKTFKSREEIGRMARHLGIVPEKTVHAHCGGGIAASGPYFALKFLLGYPDVKLYKESQFEWLRDERELPFWTYAAPYLKRDRQWVDGWNQPMLRQFGVSRVSLVDVRSAADYASGHIPYAIPIPAARFAGSAADLAALAPALGAAGIDADDEAVIVAEGGVTPSAALAFVALERLGQRRVSILMDSMDDWSLAGLVVTREPTRTGTRTGPKDIVVAATPYTAVTRSGIAVAATEPASGEFPRLYVASGKTMPKDLPPGKVVHLPYASLLAANGAPRPAAEIAALIDKAGITRFAQLVFIADQPGEAAVNYYLFRLMGYPDVKVKA